MKIKSIIFLIIICLLVFLIYLLNLDKKVYFVNITDNNNITYNKNINNYLVKNKTLEKYINIYEKDYRITDLINDINNNTNINKTQTIQNVLIKADLLVLKIGSNELNYKIKTQDINELFDYCDEMIDDINNLFKIIKKYDKEKIYFISLYNENSDYYNEIYDYLNLKIEDLCYKNNINFIKIESLNEKSNQKVYKNIVKNNILSK